MLKEQGIRAAFKPLGRPGPEYEKQKQYVRRKSRERNRIEGDIGNVKEHYGGDAIRYHYAEGSEMWVRLSFLANAGWWAAAKLCWCLGSSAAGHGFVIVLLCALGVRWFYDSAVWCVWGPGLGWHRFSAHLFC